MPFHNILIVGGDNDNILKRKLIYSLRLLIKHEIIGEHDKTLTS